MSAEDEQFVALMGHIDESWAELSQQLIVSRLSGVEERVYEYSKAHQDTWPALVEHIATMNEAELSDAERTEQALAYLQTQPGIDRAFALDYLRYDAMMGLAFAIVQKFAADQIVGGFDEMEQRACQNALQAALHSFDGLGDAQAKMIARSFIQQARKLVQDAAVELGYAEASMGRASV